MAELPGEGKVGSRRRAVRDVTITGKKIITIIIAISNICQAGTVGLGPVPRLVYLADLHNSPRMQVQLLCPFYRKLRLQEVNCCPRSHVAKWQRLKRRLLLFTPSAQRGSAFAGIWEAIRSNPLIVQRDKRKGTCPNSQSKLLS